MNSDIIITNHEPQDITIRQQDNQLIFINGGGEVIGITDVKVNGTSVVTNNIAYVIVPTKVSQLQNDSHFITTETDPTVPSVVKSITLADINNWNSKQDNLVSGTNIKTINNTSLLGSGNINIDDISYSAGTGIDITSNVISNTITSYNDLTDTPDIPTKTSDLLNDSDFVTESELSEVAFTGGYGSLSNTPEYTSDFINDGNGDYPFLLNKSANYIDGIGTLGGATAQSRNLAYTWDNGTISESHTIANYDDLTSELSTKQDTLVSGTNIKTINNQSILGSGNIAISGGGSTDVQINGTSITSGGVANIVTESAYNSTTNKIATMNDLPVITYSSSEIAIGKWIDNSTVYQKVIYMSSFTQGVNSYNHNISNLGIVIKGSVWIFNSSGTNIGIPYVTASDELSYYVTPTQVNVSSKSPTSGYTGYIILEYTKSS